MWLAPLVQVLLLAAAAPPAGGQPPAAAPVSSVPIFYSREARFAIPYHLNRPARMARELAEVQLYFSTNGGGTWQFYSKVDPVTGRFLFRAPNDGEYWFTVRTVDRAGQSSSVGANSAQLIVVVDTTPPKVQLTARRGSTGETVVHWQVEEFHPKPGSLSLQFRASATMPWQAIKLDRPQPGAVGPLQGGEVVLYPPAEVAQLELRGEVLDLAGNAGVGQAKINLRDLGPPALPPASPPTTVSIPTTPSPPAGHDALSPPTLPPGAPRADDAWRPGSDLPPPTPGSNPAQAAGDRDPAERDWPASPLRPAPGQTRVDISEQGRTDAQDGSVAVQINAPGRNQFVALDGQAPRAQCRRGFAAVRARKFDPRGGTGRGRVARRPKVAHGQFPHLRAGIRPPVRGPLRRQAGGVVGDARRRPDLETLRHRPEQSQPADRDRRRGRDLRIPPRGRERRRPGRPAAAERRSAGNLDRRRPDQAHRPHHLGRTRQRSRRRQP